MKKQPQLDLFDPLNDPDFYLLQEVFPESESDEIEYKSAQGGLPKSLWETYSAFANSLGGIIVLGVKETQSKGIQVEGFDEKQIQKLSKEFWDLVNDPQKVSVNLLKSEYVRVIQLVDKNVLAIYVPPASRSQKPVYLKKNPFDNTFKRNFEGDYKCTDEEVRRMIADADLNFHADSRILEGFDMDDFDMASIRQYRQLLSSSKPGHIWLTLDDQEFLTQLGAFRRDRKTKLSGPTMAGMLMFGKSQSIIDPECCPMYFPDYREYFSEDPEARWTDRVYPDGTWECNLFQFYKVIWPKLASRLPKPFQLNDQGQRIDDSPAHEALREAFVNCLVHSDYTAPGNIVIESHFEHYSFSNPGTLLVTLYQYYTGGVSQCRNTSIQKMFMLIGTAEKAGSGVNKIMSGWTYAHWRRPFLMLQASPDRLILEMPMASTIPEKTLEELVELFGEEVRALGRDELTILSTCEIEGDVTNSKLQYMLDIHKTDITKILQELCRTGYLTTTNKGRWTTYKLNAVDRFSKGDEDSSNEDSSNEDSSNEDSSNEDSLTRLSYEELALVIMKFCENEYMTVEEIAKAVNKSSRHLKNRIIPKMLSENKLEKRYPDNHPQQKYITKYR